MMRKAVSLFLALMLILLFSYFFLNLSRGPAGRQSESDIVSSFPEGWHIYEDVNGGQEWYFKNGWYGSFDVPQGLMFKCRNHVGSWGFKNITEFAGEKALLLISRNSSGYPFTVLFFHPGNPINFAGVINFTPYKPSPWPGQEGYNVVIQFLFRRDRSMTDHGWCEHGFSITANSTRWGHVWEYNRSYTIAYMFYKGERIIYEYNATSENWRLIYRSGMNNHRAKCVAKNLIEQFYEPHLAVAYGSAFFHSYIIWVPDWVPPYPLVFNATLTGEVYKNHVLYMNLSDVRDDSIIYIYLSDLGTPTSIVNGTLLKTLETDPVAGTNERLRYALIKPLGETIEVRWEIVETPISYAWGVVAAVGVGFAYWLYRKKRKKNF